MLLIKEIARKAYTLTATQPGREKAIRLTRLLGLRYFSNYRHEQAVKYKLRKDQSFVVHPNDHESLEIFLHRVYEAAESHVVKAVVKPNDVFVDIGANIGYYTALASALVGNNGIVYSFEPGKKTFSKLESTVRLLKLNNVRIFNVGLGEHSGGSDFYTSISGHDAVQAIRPWHGMDLVHGEYVKEQIELISLDKAIEEYQIPRERISYIKCDVEGAELSVLNGAQSIFKNSHLPVIQIELNRPALTANNCDPRSILNYLDKYYLYYRPHDTWPGIERKTQLREIRCTVWELPEICNVFAFPISGQYSDRLTMVHRAGLIAS